MVLRGAKLNYLSRLKLSTKHCAGASLRAVTFTLMLSKRLIKSEWAVAGSFMHPA